MERQIKNYIRNKTIWFGSKDAQGYFDVHFLNIPLQLHLEGNHLAIKNPHQRELFWNGSAIEEDELVIKEGDVIEDTDFVIRFFQHSIEIEIDPTAYETTLLETKSEEATFMNFPYFKRSPRVIYHLKDEKVELQAPPSKSEMSKGSLAKLLIPSLSMLAFSIVMSRVLKRGPYVYMTIGMTIITTIFSIQRFFAEKAEKKKENSKREEVYKEYLLRTRKKIRKLRQEERVALDYQNPTLSELEQMVNSYHPRIYERSGLEDDFLTVNLGYYVGRSHIPVSFNKKELEIKKDELIELADEIPKEYGLIEHIPVTIDLKKAHLGLVGSKANIHEQIKYLMAQLTFFQSYHDLQVVFIHDEKYNPDFSYMRWYPHLRIHAINVIGEISSEQARDQILGSIQQMLKDRKQKLQEEKQETIFIPHLLFIVDEPKMILNHAIMEYLQNKQLELGFSMIYTTDQQANLPENIQTICLLHNTQEATLLLEHGVRKNRSFEVQHIGAVHLEKMARNLSALIHEQGVSSKIPESITFFEMYKVNHPKELKVLERWKKNQSHKTLAVPLGVRAEEDYVDLNLHEKAHGPHGLVAGTTGSGKSEIVQSYILSLAVNFHPHEVGFLLIDYKGGGMANLFADLPHLLGTITNLDKAESMRAMASIKSELSRRQRIFGEHNVNHINGYNKLFKMGKVAEPLPHLFLISDEFAELKKEQPEFMSELVSAARIGRSLGIHLILATQKPSGVVDDQIWTNSKFKLCLKVQNAGDSKEMLKTPDAANITQAGRSYLQVGNNEIYELFQSAWSGATYHGNQEQEETIEEDDRVYLLNILGQGEVINQDFSGGEEVMQIKETQLDAVVTHLHHIYEEEAPVAVKKPWLPSLADQIVSPHTSNVVDSGSFDVADYTLGIGLIDIPEEQIQEEYQLDLVKNGHLLYLASSGYGKSVFLANIILGLGMKNAVRDLNFYIIDLGNSALISLKGLPHVADYMGLDDMEKLTKFQRIILEEIRDRKRKFAKEMAQNFTVYNEMSGEPLKAIVIVLDNYDVIKELGDAPEVFIQKVARDGASLGIYLITTLTRISVMRHPTLVNFKEKISGYNFDESETRSFIGRSEYTISDSMKGRALVKRENVNMMQLYLPVEGETESQYNIKLKTLIQQVAEASSEEKATEIPILPEVLRMEDLAKYPGYEKTKKKIPVGIDAETLEIKYLDFQEGFALAMGCVRSGKSNTVKTLLNMRGDHRTFIFDGVEGQLRRFDDQVNCTYANTKETIQEQLKQIEQIVLERKEDYEDERIDNVTLTLKEFSKELKPVYVIIDNLQELLTITEDKGTFDTLVMAGKYGVCILVTSDNKLRKTIGCELINVLLASLEALVLGSMKDQSLFSSIGIREDNKKVDYGYYHNRGVTTKIKLIENKE